VTALGRWFRRIAHSDIRVAGSMEQLDQNAFLKTRCSVLVARLTH
jgi:hypothetical protein